MRCTASIWAGVKMRQGWCQRMLGLEVDRGADVLLNSVEEPRMGRRRNPSSLA